MTMKQEQGATTEYVFQFQKGISEDDRLWLIEILRQNSIKWGLDELKENGRVEVVNSLHIDRLFNGLTALKLIPYYETQ